MDLVRHGAAAIGAAVAGPVLAAGAALRPAWREGARDRLGGSPRVEPGAIWIHGASVGEILAASRLVDRLRKDGHGIVASTFTVTGRDVMRRVRPDVPCALAPLDHPWCVDAALSRVRPSALVLIETELWPSWIAAAERRGVPVVLISGRVSDRSFPRYRRLAWLVGRTLRRLAAVGARTDVDGERFVALGADPSRVRVTGDLKIELDERPRPLAPDLDRALGGTPLIVAGSTHRGEERAVLAALRALEREGLEAALVLAPRHPSRAKEVEGLVRRSERSLRRRRALGTEPLRAGEVLVLDTVGELTPIYARAEVAFVGGTLVPHGGHNILEPVFAGRPVVYGRHTANVRHAVEILERSGAGRRVEDAAELGRAIVELVREKEAARVRAERARHELERHRGSAERAALVIERAVEAARAL